MSLAAIVPLRPSSTGVWGLFLTLVFLLALSAVSCLAAGLLNSVPAARLPLAPFFCVRSLALPNFGVAVGYKIRAQAWKPDAGPHWTLESPDPGMGSSLKISVMDTLKLPLRASKINGGAL